jgi:hypothetical protein
MTDRCLPRRSFGVGGSHIGIHASPRFIQTNLTLRFSNRCFAAAFGRGSDYPDELNFAQTLRSGY